MKSQQCINDFLNSDDPLCSEAIDMLLKHKEEELYVDYKEDFNPSDNKAWVGITTDVMAFANNLGGYIVFGVQDITFELVGLKEQIAACLSDINAVQQKLNRYVLPKFTDIRAKKHITSGGTIVVLHVPESKGATHIYIEDVYYKYPSGEPKLLIHKGMVYVRGSGNNQIIDPTGLERVIRRRITHYKDFLLSNITRLTEAGPEHQVLILDPISKEKDSARCGLSSSPDAVPVKGISFTIAPSTDCEEVSGWIALAQKEPKFSLNDSQLWKKYSMRHKLNLNLEQLLGMIEFSLKLEMPIFFWMKSVSADDMKPIFTKVFKGTTNQGAKEYVLSVAAFLGKTFFSKLRNSLSAQTPDKLVNYNPKDAFSQMLVTSKQLAENENKLTEIANTLYHQNDALEKRRARALDCFLYSREDRYAKIRETSIPIAG